MDKAVARDRPTLSKAKSRADPTAARFLELERRLEDLEFKQSPFSAQETAEFRRRIKEPTEDEIEFNLDKARMTAWSTFIEEQIKGKTASMADSAIGREISAIVNEIRDICVQLPIPGMSYVR